MSTTIDSALSRLSRFAPDGITKEDLPYIAQDLNRSSRDFGLDEYPQEDRDEDWEALTFLRKNLKH